MEDVYPKQYWPGEKISDHLEFALKYDGVNLGLLHRIFEKVPQTDLTEYIQSKPTGKYARRIWFFYEFLMSQQMPVRNLTSGNYVDALDSKRYYTVQTGDKSPRHRIVNNLLGPRAFCPVVRRTKKLTEFEASDLHKRCEHILTAYPSHLLRRASRYLYHKETKSSFAIEHIKPDSLRTETFIAALEFAEQEDFCEKEKLIELQNHIVNPQFKDQDYRKTQNYVGQSMAHQSQIVHFIGPKPDDLPSLMEGLIDCHQRMTAGQVSPVIHAAVIAYGFVFLHPFEDGNGRIHRFLIHNILSLRKMVPRGLMFPVSAVMQKNPMDYDTSLEAFSRPLLRHIDHQLDETGRMTVTNQTAYWYQYMNMTTQAEALCDFIIKVIDEELVAELGFLTSYDNTKRAIQVIIDMPDRLIDQFIQFCLQNNHKLSTRKRVRCFSFLTDVELATMERAVKEGYSRTNLG